MRGRSRVPRRPKRAGGALGAWCAGTALGASARLVEVMAQRVPEIDEITHTGRWYRRRLSKQS